MNTLQNVRWENASRRRYFEAHVGFDIYGFLVLMKYWGSLDSRLGGISCTVCIDMSDAEYLVKEIHKTRTKHHYTLKRSTFELCESPIETSWACY